MDFEVHYTEEQETFRKEVRAFFDANIRPDLKPDYDEARRTRESYQHGRELRRKLGQKGWLAPLFPKEYGGGGLTVAESVIIAEELAAYQHYMVYDSGMNLAAPAIMVWGTEEQKKRFLTPMLTGELISWQCFTEPEAGTDLASLKLRADKDGDDFILNGQKIFIGADGDVDWLYTLAITDPAKPRHANMGAFIVPTSTPGVTIQPMSMIVGKTKNVIFYDNVRVPRVQLIGGETDGWRIAQSTLEVEHGGAGSVARRNPFVDGLFDYSRQTMRNGQPLSKDATARDTLVNIWMTAQVQRLFMLRNYWMRANKVQWAWEGSQNALYRKNQMPKIAQQVLSALGPSALLSDSQWAAMGGEAEYEQRFSILTHPGGTPEAQKIVMARRIGIAKTKQTAAAIH